MSPIINYLILKNTKSTLFFVIVLFTLFLPLRGLAQPADWVLAKYEAYNYNYNYNSVPTALAYRLMRPINFDISKKYPVIVTLHGGTAFRLPQSPRYNIYNLQEYNEQLADDAIRTEYPAYVLAPQGKSDLFWQPEDLIGIQGIIASLESADLNRIYLMGTSAGGNGTHDFISSDPTYFAAAISSAANPDKIGVAKRANLVNFNLWHMVGEADLDLNRYPGSVTFFNDMKARNAKMKFTIFWKSGHSIGDSMIASEQIFSTYRNGFKTELAGTNSDPEPDTLKWLFSKSKAGELGISNVNKDSFTIHPNPTQGEIYWNETPRIDEVILSNISGKTLLRIVKPSINSIDLSGLENGVYFFKMIGANIDLTKKILKK